MLALKCSVKIQRKLCNKASTGLKASDKFNQSAIQYKVQLIRTNNPSQSQAYTRKVMGFAFAVGWIGELTVPGKDCWFFIYPLDLCDLQLQSRENPYGVP